MRKAKPIIYSVLILILIISASIYSESINLGTRKAVSSLGQTLGIPSSDARTPEEADHWLMSKVFHKK